MSYPLTWIDADKKLKELFSDSKERGRIRATLLDLQDAEMRLAYFRDDDEAVKEGLVCLAARASPPLGDPSGGGQTQPGSSLPPIQLQLPDDLAAFLRRVVKNETDIEFADEISVGGSKMDLDDAKEVLVRMGFNRVETVLSEADGGASKRVFQWKKDLREDDSVNMTTAESFVQGELSKYIDGYTVVNVCQRNIFNKADATPTKRLKLRDTRTDLVLVMTEFVERAKENPRNVLEQTAGIIDTKTKEAWKKSHEEFRGQGLGQFAGCTLISQRKGVGMPVMLTNLVGDSHVFHGVPNRDGGGATVREVVFTNQDAAFQYFAGVCKKAEVVPRRKWEDLLAELDTVGPPNHPSARPQSPTINPLSTFDNDVPSTSAPPDLTECIYKETRQEFPMLHLPPFDLMMQYWDNLERGLTEGAEARSFPSYIS